MRGLAEDGGMMIPVSIPKVEVESFRSLSYTEMAYKIMRLYVSEEEIPGGN